MPDPIFSPAGLAIQAHLELQQTAIGRLSATRASCKALAVALVVAFFLLTRTGPTPSFWLLAPLALLVLLDACCLAGERQERKAREAFLSQLKDTVPDRMKMLDLPAATTRTMVSAANIEGFLWALLSPAIWFYYGLLATVVASIPVNATAGPRPALAQPPYTKPVSSSPIQSPGSRPNFQGPPPSFQGPQPRPNGTTAPQIRPVAPSSAPAPGSAPKSAIPSPSPVAPVTKPSAPSGAATPPLPVAPQPSSSANATAKPAAP